MPILIGIAAAGAALFLALVMSIGKLKESSATISHTARELLIRLQAMEDRIGAIEHTTNEKLASLRDEMRISSRAEREEIARNFHSLGDIQSRQLKEIASMQKDSLEMLSSRLAELTASSESKQDVLRESVEKRLKELQESNENRLEKMREVVDEKLHNVLEKRLESAFSNVSEWLDKVHKGLGEMVKLASDVGDLSGLLKNVKIRGMWGEMQLGSLLEQVMNDGQYSANVEVVPGSGQRVEFALRLPGSNQDEPVWLPLDSKFPQEDYLRIMEASERADVEALESARRSLEKRIVEEARKIHAKYIAPPHTTDFGVLFLPIEGLYAEVLRIDGLCERLMREERVVVSGPTTIAALLNSLQMGFRTLAVEKRSSEVWELLNQIKIEFSRFKEIINAVQAKIESAGKTLEKAGQRSRVIERKLGNITESTAETGVLPPVAEDYLDEIDTSDYENF